MNATAQRPVDRWFASYSGDHVNETNQLIHVFAVPAILWTVVALLWCIPVFGTWVKSGAWAALAMFGAPLEHVWGDRRYLTYYVVCIVGAALCQIGVGMWAMSQGQQAYPTVGASGGIFGLLLAYGMLFPHQRVMLLIPPIPMKARTLVIVYGAIELLLGITNAMPGVAHFAHLGGMLFGWLLIRYWRGQPPFGRKGPPRMRVVR